MIDKTRLKEFVYGHENVEIIDDEQLIMLILSTLSKEEKYVVTKRFSLDFPTYEKIGENYPYKEKRYLHKGVSKERIRQILQKARRRLRHPSRRKYLLKTKKDKND